MLARRRDSDQPMIVPLHVGEPSVTLVDASTDSAYALSERAPKRAPERAASAAGADRTKRRLEDARSMRACSWTTPSAERQIWPRSESKIYERSGSGLGVPCQRLVRIFDAKGLSAVGPRSRCRWPRGGPRSPGGLRPMSWQLARRHHSGATQNVAHRREVQSRR